MKKAILLALLLSGCAEYQERQNEERIASYQAQCNAYGFKPATQPFADCMFGLDQQYNANRTALVGAMLANQANQPRQQPYMMPATPIAPAPAPRICQSQVNGQMINTTCY